MSDTSKRRTPNTPFEEPTKSPRTSYSAAPTSSAIYRIPIPTPEQALIHQMVLLETPKENQMVLPAFPERVPNISTWGHTLFNFGKYKGTNTSYYDVAVAKDNVAVGYIK